jgi:hypothetical protein
VVSGVFYAQTRRISGSDFLSAAGFHHSLGIGGLNFLCSFSVFFLSSFFFRVYFTPLAAIKEGARRAFHKQRRRERPQRSFL